MTKFFLQVLKQKGFTLLELIVVLLVISVLAAFSLPILIRQVGKAKETEAKNNLSAISFAQQGYFFEYREFAATYDTLGIGLSPKFFVFPDPESIPGTFRTKSQAISIESSALGSSRNFSYGTYYFNQAYSVVLCQSPDTITITQAPDSHTGTCINGININ